MLSTQAADHTDIRANGPRLVMGNYFDASELVEGRATITVDVPLDVFVEEATGAAVSALTGNSAETLSYENRYLAEDALDHIKVVYKPLPAVIAPLDAAKDGAPLVGCAMAFAPARLVTLPPSVRHIDTVA